MEFGYPVHYSEDPEAPGMWNARVPGLDGTEQGPMTCGDDLTDVRQMASGLIDAWISIYLKESRELPAPGLLPEGEGWELTYPGLRMQFVYLTKTYRNRSGLSQLETARKLGVDQGQYARLEDPKKANPTLATVQKVAKALDFPICLMDSQTLPARARANPKLRGPREEVQR